MWFLIGLLAFQRPATKEIGDWIHQVWENRRADTFHQYLINGKACPGAAIGVKQEGARFVMLLQFPAKSWTKWIEFPPGSESSMRIGDPEPEEIIWRWAPEYSLETDIDVETIEQLREARELIVHIRSRSGTDDRFVFKFGPETSRAVQAFLEASLRAG